jgi:hypothetical protein
MTKWSDYSMKLTDDQRLTLKKAIELLSHYDKEDCSHALHFFRRKDVYGDEIGEEVCDNEKCVKAYLKHIYTVYDPYNNGDHESIDHCAICFRPLNEQLTWIGSEFEHHVEYSTTKEDLTESCVAFDVRCMLEAMPTIDHKIDTYHIHESQMGNDQPLKDALAHQKKFVDKVVAYAELVISVLE